jgi:tetratricopeptide (TPR) repeat protein
MLRWTFAAVALAVAAGASADQTPAMLAYGRGIDCFQARNWSGAESAFRDAVRLKTDYAEAYDKLGESLFNQGKVFDAVTQFRLSVAIDPRLTVAWYDLGYGYENLDGDVKVKDDAKTRKKLMRTEVDQAIVAYQKALEVSEGNDLASRVNSHFRLGVLLRDRALAAWDAAHPEASTAPGAPLDMDKANLKEAMLHLEAANELNKDFPEARNELGRLYDVIGRYPEAIEQYDKAIRGDKNFAEAYSNRGVAWWKMGKWDRALEDERKAVEVDPNFAGGHYNFGEVVYAHVEELRLNGKDSERSVIHLESQKAVEEYTLATKLDPKFMAAWYGLAKAEEGYFDFAAAEKTYNQILAMDSRQHKAKKLLKDLQKQEKSYLSHIPKEYRPDQVQGN